jgi:Spy/CpxP family protein refolding chaperone
MKAIVITLGLLMASTSSLAEQDGGRPDADHEKRRAHIQQELGLSSEQVEQMREIREQGGSREDMRAILTEEQQTKAEEMRAKHREKRAERMDRMKEHLELTDEQVEQMREIREQGGSREEAHAVLTDEQQAKLEEARK